MLGFKNSMKNAAKLDLVVPMPFLGKAKVVIGQHVLKKHGYGLRGFDKPRAVRRYLPRKQTELVRECLPESIRHGLVIVNLTEIRLLAPHIHTDEKAVINFYLEANGEKTTFWDGEVVSDDSDVSDNGNGYINLRRDVLTEAESFIAKPFDVWAMDTCKPHSVSYVEDARNKDLHFEPLNDEKRLLMQAFFSIPFNEVRDALHDKII
jgi:hypothetical protein